MDKSAATFKEQRPTDRRYFPALVELAKDKGWIGQTLSSLPGWMLRAADKWAEQDFDYEQAHQNPNRLPLPDPWRTLLKAPAVPEQVQKVSRAAQSQLFGLRQLCRRATGVASSETDWQQESLRAKANGDQARAKRAANRVANALWKLQPAQPMVQEFIGSSPDRLEHVKAWQKRRRAQLIHRGEKQGADKIEPLPGWTEIQREFPLEAMLVIGWVRWSADDGPPGFMFWRNAALTKFMLAVRRRRKIDFSELGRYFIKNIRQNLELVPVEDAANLVWDVSVTPRQGGGGWHVKGWQRNGTVAFDRSLGWIAAH